jgi:hypothetical protein
MTNIEQAVTEENPSVVKKEEQIELSVSELDMVGGGNMNAIW